MVHTGGPVRCCILADAVLRHASVETAVRGRGHRDAAGPQHRFQQKGPVCHDIVRTAAV